MSDGSKLSVFQESDWYKDGIRFSCTGCGKCCTGQPGYVWISKEEMQQIADFLKISLETFMRTYVRQKGGRYALVEKPSRNYDCVFLKENRCTIYPVRPTQCKTYPWWQSNLKSKECWERAKELCEGIRDDAPVIPYAEIKANLDLQEPPAASL